jgi:hypothetical protein
VKETVQDSGLPLDFIDVTMQCISTARMQVLWNGEALDSFCPSRGILFHHIFLSCVSRDFSI